MAEYTWKNHLLLLKFNKHCNIKKVCSTCKKSQKLLTTSPLVSYTSNGANNK